VLLRDVRGDPVPGHPALPAGRDVLDLHAVLHGIDDAAGAIGLIPRLRQVIVSPLASASLSMPDPPVARPARRSGPPGRPDHDCPRLSMSPTFAFRLGTSGVLTNA